MGYSRSSDLKGRFIAYGLPPKDAAELQREVLKWETNSGPEWTVDRLKSLKGDIVRIQAGLAPLTWVKKNRNGEWSGVWGSLRRASERDLKGFSMVLNCLMCYSSFVPDGPTDSHVKKMRESVETKVVIIPPNLCRDLSSHAQKILGVQHLGPHRPLVTLQGRKATKSPIWGSRSVAQSDYLEKELEWFEPQEHLNFVLRHWQSYSPVLQGVNHRTLAELGITVPHCESGSVFWGPKSTLRPAFTPVAGGSLVPLTKDGGWKVRWIASPYRIHQAALNPLGQALFSLLRELPWDCTFHQEKAYEQVKKHLRKGRTAFAVDLSSATDYFPLDLQLSILRGLFPKGEHQVELFEELSRSIWDARDWGQVSWTQGQPMGLYPSFASFALAHGVLLDALSGGVPGRFYVLGDDVIILHRPTYDRYLQALQLLGCPHNPDKTIQSNRLTEFAGKIITSERVVSAFKWRDPNSKNFIELMRTFGQGFEPQLGRRERRVYRAVGRLLPPYGCNHTRGLGVPLERVVLETELFKDRIPEASGRSVHTSFLHRLAELLKPNRPDSLFFKLRWGWFKAEADRLDERQVKAFENTPFRLHPGDRGRLADFLEVNDLPIDLPAVGPRDRVDQQDLLQFYEQVLGFTRQ